MSSQKIISPLFVCLFFVISCTPITESQVKGKGWMHLSSPNVFEHFSGNSIQLRSVNFSGKLFLREDGRLSGKDYENNTDTGIWDVNKKDQICFKFDHWYFNDVRCYSVYTKEDERIYTLFSSNGAFYSTVKLFNGDSDELSSLLKNKKKKRYQKNTFSKNQAESEPEKDQGPSNNRVDTGTYSPTESEIKHTLKTMAQNCPGCNLKGADLKNATLVGANLEGASLNRADMSRANLRRANLKDADLSGALLINANLPGANLRNSDLQGADLTGANLIKADLTGADVTGTIFTNAHLEAVIGLVKQP